MSATRAWPAPFVARTLHLIGDVQGIPYVGTKINRAEVMLRDMGRPGLPKVAHIAQVGDFCSSGPESFFTTTRNFMDAVAADGQWWATVGNHDKPIVELEPDYVRTAAQAAALMGMPGKNYVVDLGYAVLIGFYVRAWGYSTEEAPDTQWLADTLDLYSDRECIVVAHPPLRASIPNGAADILSADDIAIRAVLNPRPQARIWACGHTHSPIIAPVAKQVNIGARNIVQVNASALLNNSPGIGENKERWDPLRSLYVTILADRCEVRFRDHGAGVWIGGTPSIARKVVLPWTP